MKIIVLLLTILSITGFIGGIFLIVLGKTIYAGIVWALTVLTSSIAYHIEILYENIDRLIKLNSVNI